MNKETIFNGQSIFTNTLNSQTKNFLNAVETLSNTIGDKTLYSKVFSLVTDELGTDAVVNRILKQRLSNLELSLNFLYEMSTPIGIPGYYDSKQYKSNYLSH
jgi:ubiquinone biosynthesis protein Coq4